MSGRQVEEEIKISDEEIADTIANIDFWPSGQKIIVLPLAKEVKASSIILTTELRECDDCDGVVIAAGPSAFIDLGSDVQYTKGCRSPENMDICLDPKTGWSYHLQAGDRVTYAKFSGADIYRPRASRKTLRIMNANEVLGLTKPKNKE